SGLQPRLRVCALTRRHDPHGRGPACCRGRMWPAAPYIDVSLADGGGAGAERFTGPAESLPGLGGAAGVSAMTAVPWSTSAARGRLSRFASTPPPTPSAAPRAFPG